VDHLLAVEAPADHLHVLGGVCERAVDGLLVGLFDRLTQLGGCERPGG
jgi:hypothetical protein